MRKQLIELLVRLEKFNLTWEYGKYPSRIKELLNDLEDFKRSIDLSISKVRLEYELSEALKDEDLFDVVKAHHLRMKNKYDSVAKEHEGDYSLRKQRQGGLATEISDYLDKRNLLSKDANLLLERHWNLRASALIDVAIARKRAVKTFVDSIIEGLKAEEVDLLSE